VERGAAAAVLDCAEEKRELPKTALAGGVAIDAGDAVLKSDVPGCITNGAAGAGCEDPIIRGEGLAPAVLNEKVLFDGGVLAISPEGNDVLGFSVGSGGAAADGIFNEVCTGGTGGAAAFSLEGKDNVDAFVGTGGAAAFCDIALFVFDAGDDATGVVGASATSFVPGADAVAVAVAKIIEFDAAFDEEEADVEKTKGGFPPPVAPLNVKGLLESKVPVAAELGDVKAFTDVADERLGALGAPAVGSALPEAFFFICCFSGDGFFALDGFESRFFRVKSSLSPSFFFSSSSASLTSKL